MGVVSEPPRRPVFWFLWPRPDPHAPVDGDVRQTRWLRVTRPGPWRLVLLVPLTLAVAGALGSLALAALAEIAAGRQAVTRIVVALLVLLLCVVVLALLMRAWVVGTYVNDHGAKVSRTLSTVTVPWTRVVAIHRGRGRARWLGLPVRVDAVRVDLVLDDGDVVPTHVTSVSPDLLGRPEAFDMAALRLQRWWEETR